MITPSMPLEPWATRYLSAPTQASTAADQRRAAEREQREQRIVAALAREQAQRERVLARHAELLASANPIVHALLVAHAPSYASWGLVCHGCPPDHDCDGEEEPQSAPCPTWRLIDETTAEIAGGAE